MGESEVVQTPLIKISRSLNGLEGEIASAQGLSDYTLYLRFEPDVLEKQRVLNFGCGGSNIGRELKAKAIKTDVIDLDLKFDPESGDALVAWFYSTIRLLDAHIDPQSPLHSGLVRIRRFLAKTTGRNFTQGDGRALPFSDRTFNTVLALYSTYQVPNLAKEAVFRELLRVGDTLHCAPVFESDFRVLKSLAQELGFEIVVCHPLPRRLFPKEDFVIRKSDDYENYMENSSEQRIGPPTAESAKITRIRGRAVDAAMKGSSFIVLRRKSL